MMKYNLDEVGVVGFLCDHLDGGGHKNILTLLSWSSRLNKCHTRRSTSWKLSSYPFAIFDHDVRTLAIETDISAYVDGKGSVSLSHRLSKSLLYPL